MKKIINKVKEKVDKSTGIKFIIVGIINTIVGTSSMFALFFILQYANVNSNINYWISSVFNYIIGSIVSYILNKYYTFKDNEKSIKQIILFILNIVVCYILAYKVSLEIIKSVVENQTDLVQKIASLLFGTILFTILNYFGQKFIVFKK